MQKLLLLVGLCVLVAHLEATCSRKLVCTSQSITDFDTDNLNNFDMASHMDPLLCTHIIFKSVRPDEEMQIPPNSMPVEDRQALIGLIDGATPKTLLEVNLIGISSTIFTPSNRATFIASVINVVVAADFDGVNILWMKSGSSNPVDKRGFTLLMQDLQLELGERLLTASVSGEIPVIQKSYQVPQLAEVVDFFNVMTADLDRTCTPGQFQAAIAGMQMWVEKEAPKAKLNMGIATYGVDTNPGAASKIRAKYEVCAAASLPNTVVIDSDATIDAKAQYIVDEQFGGAYVTSLQLDDFAEVACAAGDFLVIHRIKNIIISN